MIKKVTLFVVLVLALLVASVSPAEAAGRRPDKEGRQVRQVRQARQAPQTPQATQANIYVIHGINGVDLGADMALPVDINVAGVGCALQGFTFQNVAGPVNLPAGTYDIAISLANPASPCSNAPVISGPFTFAAGQTYTVIAHLNASGAPTASQFENDTRLMKRGTARIGLAHTAFAPAVDIYVNRGQDTQTLQDVPNGAYASLDARAGNYSAWLTLPDASDRLFEASFIARPGTGYFNYVVGSAANGLYLVQFSVRLR